MTPIDKAIAALERALPFIDEAYETRASDGESYASALVTREMVKNALAALKAQQSAGVDVEGLRAVTIVDSNGVNRPEQVIGWNNCIDELSRRGMLRTMPNMFPKPPPQLTEIRFDTDCIVNGVEIKAGTKIAITPTENENDE